MWTWPSSGSGPAGPTYARLICDQLPDARVLLVKAGPVVSHPPGAHVNTIEDPGARTRAKLAAQGPTQYPYGIPTAEQRLLAHRSRRDGPILANTGLFLLGSTQEASPDFPAASLANNRGEWAPTGSAPARPAVPCVPRRLSWPTGLMLLGCHWDSLLPLMIKRYVLPWRH
jgi:hypothetical protein